MAGFYIWRKNEKFDESEINRIFVGLDYKKGKHLCSKEWDAIVFPKLQYNIPNYEIFDDGFVFGTGTFGYKRNFYNNALRVLINDIKNDSLDVNAFWGSFVIFFSDNSQTILIRDGAMLQRIYTNKKRQCYSNSLVGLLRSQGLKMTLNKDAITELLSTGLVIGEETIVSEIDFVTDTSKNHPFKILYSETEKIVPEKKYEMVVVQHATLLKNFIKDISLDWFSYLPESKLNVSITGGLDSRLITAAIISNHDNYDFYTYWRNELSKDPDFKIASQIAAHLNKKMHYKPITLSLDMTEDNLMESFRISHNSCDGVIRPGSFWDEEFSSVFYRSELSNPPYLRVTGFEGEYYRNMERLPLESNRSLNSWVRWEMIYRFAGNNFSDQKQYKYIEEKIVEKLRNTVSFDVLNLSTYKEYYRRSLVPSYRALQNNIENRAGFIISPFADTFISQNAQYITSFLGKSLQFEIDLLKNLSPELASLPNDYGFDFTKGEKTKYVIVLWQLMPPAIKHKLFTMYRGHYKDQYIFALSEKFKFISSLIDTVEELKLPLNIKKLLLRSVRGKLVLNLGYFIKHNQTWLKD